MNFPEALTIALRNLRANRLRSVLTTLGIVIGVAAVIVLVGVGQGVRAGFASSFGALATAITVDRLDGTVPGGGAPRELRDSDVTALRDPRRTPDVATVIPNRIGKGIVRFGQNNQFSADVTGTTVDYLSVNNRVVLRGQMFTTDQAESRSRVVLLGPNPTKSLFKGDAGAAVGKRVRIDRATFTVIGVLKSDGYSDDIALMPLQTARAYLLGGQDILSGMAVKAQSVAQVGRAVDQINTVLDRRHDIREPAKRDFKVTALQNQIDQFNQFMGFLSLFIVAVAAISLVVGGIGVANIMLVSVTERTREIGIRKAIGARRSAILKQFLIESTVLAGLGGLVGVLLGVGITVTGSILVPKFMPDFGAPQVSVPAIGIAVTVSLLIGLLAGGYPANRAAKLRPMEALRHQ